MKFFLVGGGTMGSVSPLLALYENLKKSEPTAKFLFVGTANGPEKAVVENYKIPFIAIASGKLRRYWDWQNLTDFFRIFTGFSQSLRLIWREQPDLVISAGGFVAVPLIWAAKILRKKIIIHQQDLRPGLANKLCAPAADLITTVFPESLKHFPQSKTKTIGNPIRSEMLNCSRQRGYDLFKLDSELPTLLILGGGTGAKFINDLVSQCLPELLTFCQIIHSVGRGKKTEEVEHPQYHSFEFLTTEMPEAMAAADLVVSRAGLGTLTELSILGKPTILVPIADSHQEDNANYYKQQQAAVVFFQQYLTPEIFVQKIKELIRNQQELKILSKNIRQMMPSNAAATLADLALKLIEAK